MGIFGTLRDICFGQPLLDVANTSEPGRPRPRSGRGTARLAAVRPRRCQIEELESRRLFAVDVAPHVLLGSVYFEEATGDDSQPDVIQVSFAGGAPGTTLNRLTINGDKRQDGLTDGDIFFDTAAGGLGAFQFDGLTIASHDGFAVNGVTVIDGGSQIVFDLSGFDAGEKLVFNIDADEAQFVDGPRVDTNSLVEGGEFQRSIMIGEFSAAGYADLKLTGLYWDAFDTNFATAYSQTGLTLNLPDDDYSAAHDYADRTAGAIVHAPQIPLATLSGWVYHDRNDDGTFSHDTEQGIGGVTLELLDSHGNGTGITTVTSENPATLGFYEFRNLLPGTYGVREVQPDGWRDGKDTAGDHGGTAADESAGRVDRITGAVLDYGDHGLNYNFGELLPGSISGRVEAHHDADCDFSEPEITLKDVQIDLLDANGHFIRSTLTDANGRYEFNDLVTGTYQVFEHQPQEFYEGEEQVGTAGGTLLEQDHIVGINIGSGVHGLNYDFCEHIGVTLSGNVYHDRSNDGVFNRPGEEGIPGVDLKLLDGNGNDTGKRATTDGAGHYEFTNLAAGAYIVVEAQPALWLDGIDTPGNLGGVADVSPPGDRLSQITINWGEDGTEYNFGEILPGSIAGRVTICDDEAAGGENDIPIPNVRVDLLDQYGQVVDTTTTDANGEYSFTNLLPGKYSVRETQPADYFSDEAHIGTGDGVIVSTNLLGSIHIHSSENLESYDFCELPPAELSGYVFIDGPVIMFAHVPPTAEEIAATHHGTRTPDDTPLANVAMELRDGVSGAAIVVGDGLPGAYSGSATDPIRVVTDSNGYYHFGGLRGGMYAVVEVQPDGVTDNVDTPGTTGGFAANPIGLLSSPVATPTVIEQATIDQFRNAVGPDAIVRIPLTAGQHSQENNFSEVVMQPEPPIIPPPPPPSPPPPPPPPPPLKPPIFPPLLPPTPPLLWAPILPVVRTTDPIEGGGDVMGYTWHLSVVNAGWPRSVTPAEGPFQLTAAQIDVAAWQNVPLDRAQWTLGLLNGDRVVIMRQAVFGNEKAIPVTGDFNGDGVTDIGVYIDGQWFLDLNGNGRWDEGDLWARLGTQDDLPVTGDWDADGKIDIGIFGPAWPRDPWAISREPGLPDADNFPTRVPASGRWPRKMKNMPPKPEDATDGARVVRRTSRGKNRADLIDHVFHYGEAGDVPVAGDWNGDGIRQIGVFHDGQWYLDLDGDGKFTERDAKFLFGQAGDLPVVGDFNGNGVDEIGVFRAGKWIIDTNNNHRIDAQDKVFELGGAGDKPVVGDWNDDGTDDPGVFHPGAATDHVARRAG